MNTQLLNDIHNQLSEPAGVDAIYYLRLPDDNSLKQYTLVYEVQNLENEDTLNDKEAIKTYSLRLRFNSPAVNSFNNISIYKGKVYGLTAVNPKVKSIVLVTEDTFWDDDLNVFTYYINFRLQYS